MRFPTDFLRSLPSGSCTGLTPQIGGGFGNPFPLFSQFFLVAVIHSVGVLPPHSIKEPFGWVFLKNPQIHLHLDEKYDIIDPAIAIMGA